MTSVLIALEEVEAGAAGGEKNCVALCSERAAGIHSLLQRVSVADGRHFAAEKFQQLCIIFTHADDSLDFLTHEGENLRVVITLVFAA